MHLTTLIQQYKNKEITSRKLIHDIKNNITYKQYILEHTQFLDNTNADIIERIYCVVHNITDQPTCPYCKYPYKFGSRFCVGYYKYCTNPKCSHAKLHQNKKLQTLSNKDKEFYIWEQSIVHVDDNIIKQIRYKKYIKFLSNSKIIDYLKKRCPDAKSLEESYDRIIKGYIHLKPLCPCCNNPVQWVGKKNKLYTKYCSLTCRAKSEETHQKIKNTLINKWGTPGCYDSEKYRGYLKETIGRETWATTESIFKRKQTLLEHYGTTSLYKVPEIQKKIKQTNIERYGSENPYDNPEIKKKYYNAMSKNKMGGTSKEEQNLYKELKEFFPDIILHYYSDAYPYNVDYYIPSKNLYIEYQGSVFHHGHAYNPNNIGDIQEYERLLDKAKSINDKRNIYYGIINIWTKVDPTKRQYAKEHNIQLLEIWPKYNLKKIIHIIKQYKES